MAESLPQPRSADTLAGQRCRNYDRQATVDKHGYAERKTNGRNAQGGVGKGMMLARVHRRIGGISYALCTKVARCA